LLKIQLPRAQSCPGAKQSQLGGGFLSTGSILTLGQVNISCEHDNCLISVLRLRAVLGSCEQGNKKKMLRLNKIMLIQGWILVEMVGEVEKI
jgi:hypothetical protein